jgi:molybdopterin-guanine dinucleotide biosynthesis protein A
MSLAVTGAILTGGASQRFGSNKALASFQGERLLDRLVRVLSEHCGEVLLVGGDPDQISGVAAVHVLDLFPGEGPLGGLATALSAASAEVLLLVACDLPLLSGPLVKALLEHAGEADVVVPETPRGLEPLCALYAKRCLPAVLGALERGERRMTAFHEAVEVLRLPSKTLPDAEALANVNTLEELRRLERAAAGRRRAREPVLKLVARIAAIAGEEMRRGALRETILSLPPQEAATLLHQILAPDAPRQPRTAVAAAASVATFAGGESLPYLFATELYQAACARGYEEVRRLLLKPGARSEALAAEIRPDPRVTGRTLGERKWMARRSNPDLIDRLLFDPDPAVLKNLLVNPRVTEREVVRIAAHRPGFADVLRAVAQSPRFGTRERVRRALARNPYTPSDVAINILPFLSDPDLREAAGDGALHVATREAATAILEERRKGRTPPQGATGSSGASGRRE